MTIGEAGESVNFQCKNVKRQYIAVFSGWYSHFDHHRWIIYQKLAIVFSNIDHICAWLRGWMDNTGITVIAVG